MPDLSFLQPDFTRETESLLAGRDEGELAVDVYETADTVFVKTAIAGIRPEDITLSLTDDILTIRGVRHEERRESAERAYVCRECHWGPFSRTIILPAEVNTAKAQAVFRSGILAIKVPKVVTSKEIKVRVEEE